PGGAAHAETGSDARRPLLVLRGCGRLARRSIARQDPPAARDWRGAYLGLCHCLIFGWHWLIFGWHCLIFGWHFLVFGWHWLCQCSSSLRSKDLHWQTSATRTRKSGCYKPLADRSQFLPARQQEAQMMPRVDQHQVIPLLLGQGAEEGMLARFGRQR